MPDAYLLDTNVVVAALKENAFVLSRMERATTADLVLSTIVLGELEFGAEKSAYGARNRSRLAALVQTLTLSPVNPEVARIYGRVRTVLERRGMPIGSNDTWIAAQALSLGAVLVTDNEREFSRVPDLRIENWLKA